VVLKDSNNTIVRLVPSSIVAKVGTSLHGSSSEALAREVDVARHLAAAGGPVVPPADELPPGPHRHAGLAVTFSRILEHRPVVLGAARTRS
jgi:hypothetical protein